MAAVLFGARKRLGASFLLVFWQCLHGSQQGCTAWRCVAPLLWTCIGNVPPSQHLHRQTSPACCCAQLQAHTEHGYARQFIRGFKVADLVGSMGDLFDAALDDPSHSPLAALQAYGHAPSAAAQLDPSQVCCVSAGLIELLGTQHGIDISDFCAKLAKLDIAHQAPAMAAARCADTARHCEPDCVR